MPDSASEQMAKRRALLTDAEREILSGEREDIKDNYRYSVESRVRTRLRDELPGDVAALQEHYPDLYDQLHEVVCGEEPSPLTFTPTGAKNISYGPSNRDSAAFVLRVGTADGTVEVHLNEDEMYELWTEVQHTPWPEPADEAHEEAHRLRQELVDRAMGADAEMLRDALNALDDRPEEL